MSVQFNTRQENGVIVLEVTGRLILGESGSGLYDRVVEHLKRGENKVVLSLGGVSYIDSSGLGEMARALTAVRREGGDIKLSSLTRKVQELVQVTQIYKIFDVRPTDAAALAAFQ
ncbi:MAG TPA: STAS domain-containing protein [Terriglobales bacterium]|nr:STAS domain-containing protein [Terriglobales bacterium]